MTIAQKSTELGIDLAQLALDANPIMTCTQNGIFHCYYAGGENQNINIIDANDVKINEYSGKIRYKTESFIESTPLATIQADFITYINAMEFIPMPDVEILTPKE